MNDGRSIVERLLENAESLSTLDLLLSLGRLDSKELSATQNDGGSRLLDLLYGDPVVIRSELEAVARDAEQMGLELIREQPALRIGTSADFPDEAWATRAWRRPSTPQLDLFFDGGTNRLANALFDLVAAEEVDQAAASLGELERADPNHALVRSVPLWLTAIRSITAGAADRWSSTETAASALALLDDERTERARERLWRRVAESGGRHPSEALVRIPDYAAVITAIGEQPTGSLDPALLARAARAAAKLGRRPLALGWLAVLCWRHPNHDRLEALVDDVVPEASLDAWFDADLDDWRHLPGLLVLMGESVARGQDCKPPASWPAALELSRDKRNIEARRAVADTCPQLLSAIL